MGNQYFQFRQFRIAQERCAMKVTTDACIQGAWTPLLPGVKRVLDIGAGTGLLSLMLTQRRPDMIIDAIEYDKNAAMQAGENVSASAWKDKINILEGDVRGYTAPVKYDLIISNPPFFTNSLLSEDTGQNLARHTLSLSQADLLRAVDRNLAEDGYASVMLPCDEYVLLKKELGKSGWFESDVLFTRHKKDAEVKRVVTIFSRKKNTGLVEHNLVIKENELTCTAAFTKLLSPFYLYL